MVFNINKKRISNKGKHIASTSDEEEEQKINTSDEDKQRSDTSVEEINESKQYSDNEDKTSLATDEIMLAILKRLETLEKLQVVHDKKSITNFKSDTSSDDTNDNVSKRKSKNDTKSKKKKTHEKRATSSLEIDNISDDDSIVCI